MFLRMGLSVACRPGKAILVLLAVFAHVVLLQRAKRVISGTPLTRRDSGYDVLKYYAFISNGHEGDFSGTGFLNNWLNVFFSFQGKPLPGHLRCGGALITPAIVQTACHCLANFGIPLKSGMILPTRKSVWETFYRVYLGSYRVSEMFVGIPSSSFVLHEKCSRIPIGNMRTTLLHDYAWISMSYRVDQYKDLRFYQIAYAPIYTKKELKKIWKFTTERSLVCLYVGFGVYQFDGNGQQINEASDVLRHGWSQSSSYLSCIDQLFERNPALRKNKVFNVSEDVTWLCTNPMLDFQRAGAGDSGGPVTCKNHYVAIVSQFWKYFPYELLGLDAAIAFAVFQNAIEYRRSFMSAVEDFHWDRKFFLTSHRRLI